MQIAYQVFNVALASGVKQLSESRLHGMTKLSGLPLVLNIKSYFTLMHQSGCVFLN